MSHLVLGDVLVVFVNTLTVDCKYTVQDCKNLHVPCQMQLSEIRKTVSQFLVTFLEYTSTFKHFEITDYCHS